MKESQGWRPCISRACGFLLSTLLGLAAHADFEVMGADKPADQYGNAQTGSFHRAITGGSTLTPAEEAELSSFFSTPTDHPYYGRVRLNFSTLTLDEIKNRSTGTDTLGRVTKGRAIANQVGLEVALGYTWSESMRGDLEYLANKNLGYSSNPVLTGTTPARKLDVQLKNSTILANIYYDFSGLNRLKPYLTAGLGFAANNIQATLTPPTAGATANTMPRKLSIAWALGGGLRVAIFSRWHIDASYRYIRLGSGLNIKADSQFKLISTYSMSALSLGLSYSF